MFQKTLIRFGWLILLICGAGISLFINQMTDVFIPVELSPEPLMWYGAAFLLYGLIVWYIHAFWGKSFLSLESILLFAVVFRMIVFFHDPLFDDSVYRHAWDGKVYQAGIHPYEITPGSERLRGFRDETLYPKVAHQDNPSVSAPLSLYIYRVVAMVWDSPYAYKILILLLDIAVMIMLVSLLRFMERATAWVIVYAWNPILILESANHAHEGMITVFLFVTGLSFALRCRSLYAAVFAGLASTLNWLILPVLPFIEDIRSRWKTWTGIAMITSAFWIVLYHTPDYLAVPVADYIESVQFGHEINSSIYLGILYLMNLITPDHNEAVRYARILITSLFLIATALLLFMYWKKSYLSQKQNMIRFVYLIMTIGLLFSPAMTPGAFLMLIPVLCLHPSLSWIVFSGFLGLYHFRTLDWFSGETWYTSVRLYEYLPFYVILITTALFHIIKKRKEFHHPEKL